MNDFTKEELKTILWHITTKTSIKPGNDLVPKIQDMIENYCKHDNKYLMAIDDNGNPFVLSVDEYAQSEINDDILEFINEFNFHQYPAGVYEFIPFYEMCGGLHCSGLNECASDCAELDIKIKKCLWSFKKWEENKK